MNHELAAAPARLRAQVERLEGTTLSESAAAHFARAVLGTGDPALSCNACQDALPEHIEAELNNRPGPRYRAMRRHLDLCLSCSAAYLDLLKIALLTEAGQLPRPVLAINLAFLKCSPTEKKPDA